MGRESKHDAVRDFLEGFSDDTDARFHTVSTRDQVAVGPDDDLEQKVAENGGDTTYVISGTHRVNLDASYDNIALVGHPESRPTLVMGDNTVPDDAWDPEGGSVVNCLGGQDDAQNDVDPVEGFYMRDIDVDGRFSEIGAGGNVSSADSALYFRHVADVRIERCRIDDARTRGINLHTTPNDSNERCWVSDCDITNSERNATHISANKAFLFGNYCEGGTDTAFEFGQLETVILDGNEVRRFQTGSILTQLYERAIISNNIFHVASAGLSSNELNGNDVNRPVVVGNVFIGDENADDNIDVDTDPSHAIAFDANNATAVGNYFEGFNSNVRIQGGSDFFIASNMFQSPRTSPMLNVTEGEREVSDVTVVGNYFNGDRGSDPDQDAIDTGDVDNVFVHGNYIFNTSDAIRVAGNDGFVGGNYIRSYNNGVVAEGVGLEAAYNHFTGGSTRGIQQTNGGDGGVYHHNHFSDSPNNGVVVQSGSAQWWENIGDATETTGTTTVSGDGTATTFTLDSHDLNNGPTDPAGTQSNIHVDLTPVSADAIAAGPVSGHVVDTGGSGTFDSVAVTFASAPASGTDNVTIRWEARMSGVRGR